MAHGLKTILWELHTTLPIHLEERTVTPAQRTWVAHTTLPTLLEEMVTPAQDKTLVILMRLPIHLEHMSCTTTLTHLEQRTMVLWQTMLWILSHTMRRIHLKSMVRTHMSA